jgi:hypothetical protein
VNEKKAGAPGHSIAHRISHRRRPRPRRTAAARRTRGIARSRSHEPHRAALAAWAWPVKQMTDRAPARRPWSPSH